MKSRNNTRAFNMILTFFALYTVGFVTRTYWLNYGNLRMFKSGKKEGELTGLQVLFFYFPFLFFKKE